VLTPLGPIPRLATRLSLADRLGALRVRLTIGRMDYKVPPGLYAIGNPDAESPVLVTANYKLTFDILRGDAHGVTAWLLVLDTHGINVWCAAGKGTFGTQELVRRLHDSGLSQLVTHRRIVVPQLGAPGVAAHEVRLATGFRVAWGPIRSADLPAFLHAGLKATPPMRAIRFTLRDRLVLAPVEIAGALKPAAWIALAMLALGVLASRSFAPAAVLSSAGGGLTMLAVGLVGGALVVPALLPWLPGRAFSAKGALVGAVLGGGIALGSGARPLSVAALALGSAALASYVAMNFTGSTPFTSLSGVDREMRRWMPLQAGSAALSVVLWVAAFILKGV